MTWAVKLDKPSFVGKLGVAARRRARVERRLVAVSFHGDAPPEGAALDRAGATSATSRPRGCSPVLGYGVALGWITRTTAAFPTDLEADGAVGTSSTMPFYDPKGERLRA